MREVIKAGTIHANVDIYLADGTVENAIVVTNATVHVEIENDYGADADGNRGVRAEYYSDANITESDLDEAAIEYMKQHNLDTEIIDVIITSIDYSTFIADTDQDNAQDKE